MRKLIFGVLMPLAILSLGLIIYAAAIYTYNRFLVDYEYRIAGWSEHSQDTKPVAWSPEQDGRVRILAISGGALLGLADLEVLKAMEERSGKRIYQLFDFIAGSSTGAIMSSLLLFPQEPTGMPMTAAQAIETYDRLAGDVFSSDLTHTVLTGFGMLGPRWKNSSRIKVAQDVFSNGTFNQLLRPTMFPGFSHKRNTVHLYANWKAENAGMYLSSLVTAVTSAPTVFPSIQLIDDSGDGDIVSDPAFVLNSPAEMAYLEARAAVPGTNEFVVIEINSNQRSDISTDTSVRGGVIQWSAPILSMVFNGEATISSQALARHQNFESDISVASVLIAPELSPDIDLFNPNAANRQRIRQAGRNFVRANPQSIDEALALLEGRGFLQER